MYFLMLQADVQILFVLHWCYNTFLNTCLR